MNEGMFQVESNIPLPHSQKKKYPWYEMEVMDSFFVPWNGEEVKKFATRISVAMSYARKRRDVRFTLRRIFKQGVFLGCRVWRIK